MSKNLNGLLSEAESFISGFEDDDTQEGVVDLLERIRAALALPAPVLAVILEGGMVSDIVCDRPDALPGLDVVVIDYDTDGVDEDALSYVRQNDGTWSDAIVHHESVSRATIGLTDIKDALEEPDECANCEDTDNLYLRHNRWECDRCGWHS